MITLNRYYADNGIQVRNHLEGHAVLYRACDECDESGHVTVVVWPYRIVKYTPCGAWIETYAGGKQRFVNLRDHVKTWASTTIPSAVDRLYHRKRRQIEIIRWQRDIAERAIDIIEHYRQRNTL